MTHDLIAPLLQIAVIFFAFLIMLGGYKRTQGVFGSFLNFMLMFLIRFVFYAVRVTVKFVINTGTLFARLLVSGGNIERITEAFSKYVERMSDAVLSF